MTSPATRARRATTSPAERESGFTLAELLVTMLVMGIVAASVMSVALRTFTTTATVTNRRDVLADGRNALDRLSKQLRQAESNGTPATIVWAVTGSAAPYVLTESTTGGANPVPVVTSLSDNDVFTYSPNGTVQAFVSIRLPLQTSTTTIEMNTDVQLRNLQADSS
jgi:prepilin-type N-terminal cleavage/methylation domain-containing protein